MRRAWVYAWSSASAHALGADATGLLDFQGWKAVIGRMDWKAALLAREDDTMILNIRRSLSRGRPLGTDCFVARLEAAVGKRLRPLLVGRPPKKSNTMSRGKKEETNR